ncbi:MAG: hypothetical protein QM611_07260 [Microbacterium sp.]
MTTLIASLVLVAAGAGSAHAVRVEDNVSPNTTNYDMQGSNAYHAYAAEGEWIHFWGSTGSTTITAPDGTVIGPATANSATISTPIQVTVATEGVWVVQTGGSLNSESSTAQNWSFAVYDGNPGFTGGTNPRSQTVATGVSEITGRVWTEAYNISQSGGTSYLKELTFWLLNDSGYQYALTLRNYNGVNSTVTATSLGLPVGLTSAGVATEDQCTPSYQSLDANTNPTGPPTVPCSVPYRVFFEEPNTDLPVSASAWDSTAAATVTQVIKPEPVDPETLSATDFTYTPTSSESAAGVFSYDLGDNFFGGYSLQIDVNNDGDYDDAVDRVIELGAAGEPIEYEFDGLDGEGNTIAPCTQLSARVYVDRIGEVHVVQTDVEARTIELIRQNGPSTGTDVIYWDDTNTSSRGNTTSVTDGTSGVASTGGVHGWTYGTNSWGNNKYIDDWTYVEADRDAATLVTPGTCLQVAKTSSADDNDASASVGDTVEYTVTATNIGDADFTADDPAVLVDDLSGVLDVADYNDDAQSDPTDGAITYSQPRLTWTGPLAAGDSVELTYSVTVTDAGGDGAGRNVAFGIPSGEDADDVDTPACDEDGYDSDTNLYCASTSFSVPSLRIEKQSDVTSLPADGATVTYTVTATNTGPGAYTTASPAIVVDDLSDVLDDATLDEDSLTASVGDDPTLDGERIVWTGALVSGQSVAITYTVTYEEGAGDATLVNVAFGPTDVDEDTPTCDPRTDDGLDEATGVPCDATSLPGSDLTVTKSASAASGTNVEPGDVLTYTLTFANDGEADATVDYTDTTTGLSDDATIADIVSEDLTAVASGDPLEQIVVTGTVPAGASYTVTYTATVLPFADQGDSILANFLLPTGAEPPASVGLDSCVPGSDDCTIHFVPHLIVTKTADPASGTAVQSGDVLTYTLQFANEGTGAATVDHVDDLSGVLDDATLTADPSTPGDTLTPVVDGETVVIAGAVAAGTTETVTYRVTVNPDGSHGDNVLSNYVFAADATPPTTCESDDTACTTHAVGELSVAKSVDPASGSDVAPGDTLRYTLSFENVGTGAYDVDLVDDLSNALDDADLTDEPASLSGHVLPGAVTADQRLPLTGTLPAGESDQVGYTLTVHDEADLGDGVIANWVLDPDAATPSTSCEVDATTPCTVNGVVLSANDNTSDDDTTDDEASDDELAATGAQLTSAAVLFALLLTAAGGVLYARRSRRA